MFRTSVVRIRALIRTRTLERYVLVASLVDHKGANLTLKALLAESPDKILAVRAERGLLEEARNEAMIFDIIDVLLLERPLPAPVPHRELVLALRHLVQGVFLLRHRGAGFFCWGLENSATPPHRTEQKNGCQQQSN